jgi:hypothetical protein
VEVHGKARLGVFDNPVMWAELRRMAARRRRLHPKLPGGVLIVAAFAGYFLLQSSGTTLTSRDVVRYLRMVPVFGLWMYALSGSSRGPSIGVELLKEFQRRTFEILSVTMLEPRSILWGKLQAHMVAGLASAMLFLPFGRWRARLRDGPGTGSRPARPWRSHPRSFSGRSRFAERSYHPG